MTAKSGSRSVTHGSCALNGMHAPGSKYLEECPVWRRQRRSEVAVVRESRKRTGRAQPTLCSGA
jgi:hypothetical protein